MIRLTYSNQVYTTKLTILVHNSMRSVFCQYIFRLIFCVILWLVTQLKIAERASLEVFQIGDTVVLGENELSVLIDEGCRGKDIPSLKPL